MSKPLSFEDVKYAVLGMFRETVEKVGDIYLEPETSLLETLDTISAEVASIPVSANCATLAAQVEHVRYYMDVMESYILGQEPENVDWRHVWNTVSTITPEAWDESRARLKASYDRIVEHLKGLNDWDQGSSLVAAMVVVVHTAYHLGNIRQSLCTLEVQS
jgi:hypothetical protein